MTDPSLHLDRVKLAARLYYVDDLSQAEVCKILGVSQAMVSRLLTEARERGIVRITVEEYEPRAVGLEREVRAAFPGLKEVVVVRDPAEAGVAGIRRNVGYFAAPVVAGMVRPGDVIGLTGGRTLEELVRRVRAGLQVRRAAPAAGTAAVVRDVRVVPLMGSIAAAVNGADAAELSRGMAEAFAGTCYALNTPAFVSTAGSRAALMGQDQVRAVWGLYGGMTLALVGVGTLRESAFIERGVLGEDDLERLARAGAVGEICGRYYDGEGRECQTEYAKRVVSIGLEELRRVPGVVAVTAGEGRGEAVAVAVRAGLVKSVVVDERCARAAVEYAAARGRGRSGTRVNA
jgi:DNA-binding transcriptional regulator LsrR (DeoR family)